MDINDILVNNVTKTYETAVNWFKSQGLYFTKDDKSMTIESSFAGRDLKMNYKITIIEEAELIIYESALPFNVPMEKAVEVSLALCAINDKLVSGCFKYYMQEQTIIFRAETSFAGRTEVSPEIIAYLVLVATGTVDDYNDKLFLLTQGVYGYEKFID